MRMVEAGDRGRTYRATGTWLFHSPDLDLYLVGTVNQITAGAVSFRMVPRLLRTVAGARE